jgi:hypothetical protein
VVIAEGGVLNIKDEKRNTYYKKSDLPLHGAAKDW